MNIEILPGAALDDAKMIDTIVSDMTDAMAELNDIINNKMGEVGSGKPISTAWAGDVISNWNAYYSSDIPETMEQMKLSATNLRMAVDAAVQYRKNSQ